MLCRRQERRKESAHADVLAKGVIKQVPGSRMVSLYRSSWISQPAVDFHSVLFCMRMKWIDEPSCDDMK